MVSLDSFDLGLVGIVYVLQLCVQDGPCLPLCAFLGAVGPTVRLEDERRGSGQDGAQGGQPSLEPHDRSPPFFAAASLPMALAPKKNRVALSSSALELPGTSRCIQVATATRANTQPQAVSFRHPIIMPTSFLR
jgi:hypothetical protein